MCGVGARSWSQNIGGEVAPLYTNRVKRWGADTARGVLNLVVRAPTPIVTERPRLQLHRFTVHSLHVPGPTSSPSTRFAPPFETILDQPVPFPLVALYLKTKEIVGVLFEEETRRRHTDARMGGWKGRVGLWGRLEAGMVEVGRRRLTIGCATDGEVALSGDTQISMDLEAT
ncbi:hypothetical protein FRC08_005411 [Ceratobasidium sp. 394]|nr:hypothetical protein FRC08_005411 [Ceratobasidium sp. 394]KAG9086836.1 hypothetical protein FS749_003336 [Ceratobasidium sp. UAMH 11750]